MAFRRLTNLFLAEESGRESEAIAGDPGELPATQPVLLFRGGQAVGMVQSDFHSRESAMVNMLYIQQGHRGNRYAPLLMQWYVRHLLGQSASACLFYSPSNAPARKIYERMGFVKSEEWTMALSK